jgi:hypothetical protein
MHSLRQRALRQLFAGQKWRGNHLPRHIVTEAFYNNEVWKERLAAPIFKKIKMGTAKFFSLKHVKKILINEQYINFVRLVFQIRINFVQIQI